MSTGGEKKVTFKLGITPDEQAAAAMAAAKKRMQDGLKEVGKTAKSTSEEVRAAAESMVNQSISPAEKLKSEMRMFFRDIDPATNGLRKAARGLGTEWTNVSAATKEYVNGLRQAEMRTAAIANQFDRLVSLTGQATRGLGAMRMAMDTKGPMKMLLAGQGVMDLWQSAKGLGKGGLLGLGAAAVGGNFLSEKLAPNAARRRRLEGNGLSRWWNSAGEDGMLREGMLNAGRFVSGGGTGNPFESGTGKGAGFLGLTKFSKWLDDMTVKGGKLVAKMEKEAELREEANARRQALASATDQFERSTSGNRRSMLDRRHALGDLTDMERNSDAQIMLQADVRKFRGQAAMAGTDQERDMATQRVRDAEAEIVRLQEQAYQIQRRGNAERKSEGQAELERMRARIELIRDEKKAANREFRGGAARFGAMSEIDRAAALELKRRFDSGEKLTRGQLGRLRGFSGDLDRKIETEFARRARAGGFGDVFTESEERFNRAERAEAKAVALHDNRQIVINMQVDNDEDAAEATKQELLRRLKELEAKFERRAARQRDVAEDRANQAPRPS